MPKEYEIDSVTVVCGENPEILFGETEMILYRGHAYRLPEIRTGRAYETGLDSVLKFEGYGKRFLGFGKYFRDEIGVNVEVDSNTVFRKDGKNVIIEWKGKRRPCVTENKSILNPEEYEKLKQIAISSCLQ